MKLFIYRFFLIGLLLAFCSQDTQAVLTTDILTIKTKKIYKGIVSGQIIKKEIKKSDNSWLTEYKLKVNKWFYKAPEINKSKYITLKILGAELPERGLVIKSSIAPAYIPIKEDAIFLLEENIRKQENVFSLSNNGVIYGDELNLFKYIKSFEYKNNNYIAHYEDNSKFRFSIRDIISGMRKGDK